MTAAPIPTRGVICFMGMDGSGKSTVIKAVGDWLADQGIPTQTYHTHDYNVKSLNTINAFGQEAWIRRFPFLFFPWPFLALVDHLATFRRKFSNQQKVVLTDRYFYDKYVRFRFWGIAVPGLFYLYKWFIPKPLFIFLLDVPSSIAIERKGEYSEADYDKFRREYLLFSRKMKAVHVVDAAQPLDSVIEVVKNVISADKVA